MAIIEILSIETRGLVPGANAVILLPRVSLGTVDCSTAIHHSGGVLRRPTTVRTLFAVLLLSTSALAHEPQVHRDLAYAEPKNERQTLDVYAPGQGKNHPIVLWIHGGGWQAGDKTDVQVKPQAFVDRGFVFVSTNYRLLPNATIKEMAATSPSRSAGSTITPGSTAATPTRSS